MKPRLSILIIALVPFLIGASRPLNPLVTRATAIRGPVPVECEEGLSDTPALRVQVAELPPPVTTAADLSAPPSRALRAELEDAQAALVRNDRPSFDEHLAAAREIVASYPPGAERRAAEDVLGVYDAASRVWTAQFDTPFFDDASDAYSAANAYPGYEDAVRRNVFVDDRDRRFYPAAESREFLARVAQSRLTRLGIRGSAPPVRVARAMPRDEDEDARPLPNVKPRHKSSSSSSSASPVHVARRTPPSSSHHVRKSKPMPAALRVPLSPSSPDRSAPHVAAAAPTPAAPPPSVAAPTPAPETPALPAAGEVPQPATTDTSMTTSAAEPAVTETTTGKETRSVVLPAMLILIGLGVLIVLFRASK